MHVLAWIADRVLVVLVGALAAGAAAALRGGAGGAPALRPTFWRCCVCAAVFTDGLGLADHLEGVHPEALPRVDAC